MAFAGINYGAVLVAAVAAWLVGAGWYMALAKPWMAAQGWKSEAEMLGPSGKPSPLPFVLAFVAELVMAWVLAGVVGHLGAVTVRNGVISGLFLWLGFVLTSTGVNYAFSKRPLKLTMIDAGHWLAVLMVMGAIIGAMGVSVRPSLIRHPEAAAKRPSKDARPGAFEARLRRAPQGDGT